MRAESLSFDSLGWSPYFTESDAPSIAICMEGRERALVAGTDGDEGNRADAAGYREPKGGEKRVLSVRQPCDHPSHNEWEQSSAAKMYLIHREDTAHH